MPEEMNQAEALQTLESAINPQEQTQEASTPEEEALEYFIGDKPGKLPLSALLALKEKNQVEKVPFSKIVNGYRMNAQSTRKLEEFSKLKPQYEMTSAELAKYKEQEESFKPYKALQDWSVELETKNPVAFKYLMDTIERVKAGTYNTSQEGAAQGDQSALHATISQQAEKINQLLEWKSQFEQQNEQKHAEESRKFVDGEIETMKKEFPEINLDEQDENLIPLYTRIEKFGVEKGYQTFTDAFHAYFRPKIAEILVTRGKNEAVGNIKKDYKKGIVARSSTPFVNGHPITAGNDNKMLQEFEAILNRSNQ